VKSFTARIDELTDRNAELEAELEQWKSAASQAQLLNCELGATLDATQSNASSLQQENERITETCRQITLAAKFYNTRASQANEVIKEIFGAFESARAKIPLSNQKPIT
jgi:chromosome segregation ATPase